MTRVIRVSILLAVFAASAVAADTPEQLIKAGHWKRARPLIEAAYAQNPKDSHNLALMARLKKVLGDVDGAHKFAEQAVAADPNNYMAHFVFADILGDEASKASVFKQMSMAGKLRNEIESAVRLNPNDVDSHWGMMQYYLQAPGIAGGSKDKARAEIAAIAKISAASGYLAQIEYDNHEKQTANIEELYRKAHEAEPQNYNATQSWCNYQLNQKHFDVAEKCAAELIKLDRGRGAGYSLLAVTYVLEKKWSELDGVLTDAEKNIPDSRVPYFNAGRNLAQNGYDNARGERYLRYYLQQDPEPNAPKFSRVHWYLGQLAEKSGRKPDAVAEYQTAVQMEPSFEPAQKDLKRLK